MSQTVDRCRRRHRILENRLPLAERKIARQHQIRNGSPDEETAGDDPRARLRRIIGYRENNQHRMKYEEYRKAGLPTTSAWMESAGKEMNYRIKGTEMFWNNPVGAEAILQIRAAALCDDDRLVRAMTRRPGAGKLRRNYKRQAA